MRISQRGNTADLRRGMAHATWQAVGRARHAMRRCRDNCVARQRTLGRQSNGQTSSRRSPRGARRSAAVAQKPCSAALACGGCGSCVICCMLPVACCLQHVVLGMSSVVRFTLHVAVACCPLHVVRCMTSVACRPLSVTCRMLSLACRPLSVSRCMSSVACCHWCVRPWRLQRHRLAPHATRCTHRCTLPQASVPKQSKAQPCLAAERSATQRCRSANGAGKSASLQRVRRSRC